MKNLYVNGCSFTHGHKDYIIENGISKPGHYTWPAQIQKHSKCNLVNEAYSGGSNSRIVRRTIEYMSKVKDPENWVVVIQFTSLERDEYFDNNKQIWIGNVVDAGCFDDRSGFYNPISANIKQDTIFKNFVRNQIFSKSHVLDVYKLAQQTLFLQMFLDKLGFKKVLFTGQSKRCLINYYMEDKLNPGHDIDLRPKISDSKEFEAIKLIYNNIDSSNFITPLSHVTRGLEESLEDGHPNDEGHRVFSRYIIEQLVLRNWYE